MLIFLHNFLLDRKFQVKLKNALSDYLKIEWFASIINDIFNNLQHLIIYTLFTDEYNIYCRIMNMKTSVGLLQTAIKSLQHGTYSTGFKLLSSKTQCIIFNNKKKHNDVFYHVYLNKIIIKVIVRDLGDTTATAGFRTASDRLSSPLWTHPRLALNSSRRSRAKR